MANANFIVQNGINIGGSSGANISVDTTTGAIIFAPAPTASVPNPTATVFTTTGTVQTVATTGGVASGSAIAAANSASATSLTNGTANVTVNTANITMGVGGTQVWTVTSSGVTGAGSAQFNSLNVTGTATAAIVNAATIGNTGATLTGTLSTASQPNVTAVGTLTGLTVSGATTAAAITSSGTIIASTLNAGTIGNSGAVLYGTLNSSSASQPNITTLAGVTSIGTSGVTTTAAGNFTITGCLTVNGTTTTINNTVYETTEYVSTVDATTLRAATIGNSGAVLYGTLNSSSASQTNITAVGTLTGLTVSGTVAINASGGITTNQSTFPIANTTATTINLGGAATSVYIGASSDASILPNANVATNIGSTSAWFNNIYGTAQHSLYADLAENYQADKFYNPGTVLMFGGAQEVTIADADTTRVAGVVSTNPAHLMNGALSGPNVTPVAFTGRVPCQVIGPVAKGDLMVSAGFGYAKVNNTPQVGTVIGKALQDFQIAGKGVIEVVVGRF